MKQLAFATVVAAILVAIVIGAIALVNAFPWFGAVLAFVAFVAVVYTILDED